MVGCDSDLALAIGLLANAQVLVVEDDDKEVAQAATRQRAFERDVTQEDMLSEQQLLSFGLGVVGDDKSAALRLLGSGALRHRLQHHSNARAVRLEHLVATPAGLFLCLVHDLLQIACAFPPRLDDLSALSEGLLCHRDRTIGAHRERRHRHVVLMVPPVVLLEDLLVQDALVRVRVRVRMR